MGRKVVVAIAVALAIASAAVTVAQVGDVNFVVSRWGTGESSRTEANFRGHADRLTKAGNRVTYSGSVTIAFADGMKLTADEVTWDQDARELTASGTVMLKLDR